VPLNASRAGVCERPEDWPWSSYRATIGLEEAPAYLAVADVLRLFAPEDSRARARYITFIRDGLR
jgi:hypothetical protein